MLFMLWCACVSCRCSAVMLLDFNLFAHIYHCKWLWICLMQYGFYCFTDWRLYDFYILTCDDANNNLHWCWMCPFTLCTWPLEQNLQRCMVVNSVAMHEAFSCSTPQFLVTNLNIAKSAFNILSVNKIECCMDSYWNYLLINVAAPLIILQIILSNKFWIKLE